MAEKSNTKSFSLRELLDLEEALKITCLKYEMNARSYDGTIIEGNHHDLYMKYSKMHNDILSQIEKKICETL